MGEQITATTDLCTMCKKARTEDDKRVDVIAPEYEGYCWICVEKCET